MSLFRSKRAMDMTIGVVIAIVLGLIIVAILFFALRSKSGVLNDTGRCPEEECKTKSESCPGDLVHSYTPCTKGNDVRGVCCVPPIGS